MDIGCGSIPGRSGGPSACHCDNTGSGDCPDSCPMETKASLNFTSHITLCDLVLDRLCDEVLFEVIIVDKYIPE